MSDEKQKMIAGALYCPTDETYARIDCGRVNSSINTIILRLMK